jgi:pSer/pThr/pTyr-binding forkhead associated (FHA) protein
VAILEVLTPHGREVVELDGASLVVGKSRECDVVIDTDPTVSRRHVRFELVASAWVVSDLDSTNGTQVNGHRLYGDHALRDGDELVLGHTRLLYKARGTVLEPSTETMGSAPAITPREKAVLVELCRPLLSGGAFTPPATVSEIAARLFVGDSAVKGHLDRLYDKFLIDEGRERRTRLANAAIQTGAVSFRDLKPRE